MSSKGDGKTKEEVLAARQAKKQGKNKPNKKLTDDKKNTPQSSVNSPRAESLQSENVDAKNQLNPENTEENAKITPKATSSNDKLTAPPKEALKANQSRDEVDKAVKLEPELTAETSKEHIKAERAAKKAAKQAKKKNTTEGDTQNKAGNSNVEQIKTDAKAVAKPNADSKATPKNVDKTKNVDKSKDVGNANTNISEAVLAVADSPVSAATIKEMVDTLKDIVVVARDVQAVTDKVKAINIGAKKEEDSTKSKAELKAERRAKQEAQRAAKQATQQNAAEVKKESTKEPSLPKEEKSTKAKTVDKTKPKPQGMQKMNWFQHLYTEHDKEALKQMQISSNLHPAVIKLGIQLASHVVTGSNARCIALLDTLKKMVRDYSLPARTEFARGLEAQLAASEEFLWGMRPPAASQTNALKYFRHHLTQLPNNVDEFDAKKQLQEEIDRYIGEQIDKAGEAISTAVREKISNGDNILTYGCSSLIERIFSEAHAAGVQFRAVVVGTRVQRAAREMLRRLVARGVPCTYADISALSFLMRHMSKVLVGAASLLANGAVLAPVGSLQAALVARAHNVPLLVACETHKFSDNVQTDAFVYNEIGDPDDIIDKSDENSPLKDWRSNPNLTLLNLTYDVTPPSLVTAVVTEQAILPCTSAPVVLRFKLS
ncbi:translation initiation factor eIF-2B subunit delta isoform X2 [Bicyclus anynana]|nr:translation initiation factor eIF-2B subunit delta isoform X2 [Bicyclus anynana]